MNQSLIAFECYREWLSLLIHWVALVYGIVLVMCHMICAIRMIGNVRVELRTVIELLVVTVMLRQNHVSVWFEDDERKSEHVRPVLDADADLKWRMSGHLSQPHHRAKTVS